MDIKDREVEFKAITENVKLLDDENQRIKQNNNNK